MAPEPFKVKSVAVIGAGAAGAAMAAALVAESHYEVIRIFERRNSPGGTWIYDSDPGDLPVHPGAIPPEIDVHSDIPDGPFPRVLPRTTNRQPRYDRTPIYEELTTNVPDIAMSYTDLPFAYGPFAPHWVPKLYIEDYFLRHRTDRFLVLNTTVEDLSLISRKTGRWRLTLRRPIPGKNEDSWWQEEFDGVVIANGHYSVPHVPFVSGLEDFMSKFPGKAEHSKVYRSPRQYIKQRVVVIGNSSSGHDVLTQLNNSGVCKKPIYVSRRSRSRWDGDKPPDGVVWKPVIERYDATTGHIYFADGTKLEDVDRVIYCTGYRASFPFWNEDRNGGHLFDYVNDRLINNFQHTFLTDFPTLAVVGMPRVLTFRSFEYQSIAIARLWSNRSKIPLPSLGEQKDWLNKRAELTRSERRKFHQIDWDTGETMDWFRYLFDLAGLPLLEGVGRCPPVLGEQTRWAIDHIKKYPDRKAQREEHVKEEDWQLIDACGKDTLWFI